MTNHDLAALLFCAMAAIETPDDLSADDKDALVELLAEAAAQFSPDTEQVQP